MMLSSLTWRRGSSNGSTASNRSQRRAVVLSLEGFGMEMEFGRDGRGASDHFNMLASAPADMGYSGASMARSPEARHSGRSGSRRGHESGSFSPAAASGRYHSPRAGSREQPNPFDPLSDTRPLAARRDSPGRTSGEASEAGYSGRKSPRQAADSNGLRRRPEKGLQHTGSGGEVSSDRMSGSKVCTIGKVTIGRVVDLRSVCKSERRVQSCGLYQGV